ncbi:hypothetical protein NDA01_15140 [Trichocoleus desertorum AS-A10]|uniref:hypothetical protein n=1 Tax=Trichocoleus desertorum TaxID=1481672 RepID=UPI003296DF1D
MLLVLDPSLISGINQNLNVVDALDLIADARRLGKHMVFGQREVIKFLVNCEQLSMRARSVYRKLYEDLPTTKEYLNRINLSVEIVFEDTLEVLETEKSKVIRASFKYFTDFSILDKTILLAEDHDDILLYHRIVNAYLKWNNWSGVSIKFDARSGGGRNTDKAFNIIQGSKERFCLCLLDSDRETPKSSVGDTAASVLKINDKNQPLCDAIAIGVRAVENLVPTSIYRKVFSHDPNKKTALLFLDTLESSQFLESRIYLDFKKDLKLEKILKEPPNTEFRKYWINFAREFSSGNMQISSTCLEQQVCAQPSSCQCCVTLGLGTRIIKKVESTYSNRDISDMVCDNLKPEWEKIGYLIVSWCCASSQLSTIGASS